MQSMDVGRRKQVSRCLREALLVVGTIRSGNGILDSVRMRLRVQAQVRP
jgi:hypothetical protein